MTADVTPSSQAVDHPRVMAALGSMVFLGAIVWWVYTGTPSVWVSGDSVVVAGLGLSMIAVVFRSIRRKFVVLLAVALSSTVLGLAIAHVSPAYAGEPFGDRELAGSPMIFGSLVYLLGPVRKMTARFHAVAIAVTLVLASGWIYLLVLLSRNIAEA